MAIVADRHAATKQPVRIKNHGPVFARDNLDDKVSPSASANKLFEMRQRAKQNSA
jgi:hypothetical protein